MSNMPWHGASEVRFADLPEDLQCLIEQLVDDDDRPVPEVLPLVEVAVSGLPDVPLGNDDRGDAYALEMDLAETPPLLVADGRFLDGRHRAFAARAAGVDHLLAIDLSGIVPFEAYRWEDMGEVTDIRRAPSGPVPR